MPIPTTRRTADSGATSALADMFILPRSAGQPAPRPVPRLNHHERDRTAGRQAPPFQLVTNPSSRPAYSWVSSDYERCYDEPRAARMTTTIKERYVLGREIGRGATATVYLSRDNRLGRDVAIKLFRNDLPH